MLRFCASDYILRMGERTFKGHNISVLAQQEQFACLCLRTGAQVIKISTTSQNSAPVIATVPMQGVMAGAAAPLYQRRHLLPRQVEET